MSGVESNQIIKTLYAAANEGWVVVSGPGGSGITAVLRGLVTEAASLGAEAPPVLLCEHPTDYSTVDLRAMAQDFRMRPFFVLDGVNFACAALLHTLPPELHGVVGMTASTPGHAWKWVLPQQRGARITMLYLNWDEWSPRRTCALFTGPRPEGVGLGRLDSTEITRLHETPLPTRGLVRVETWRGRDGSHGLRYAPHPGSANQGDGAAARRVLPA